MSGYGTESSRLGQYILSWAGSRGREWQDYHRLHINTIQQNASPGLYNVKNKDRTGQQRLLYNWQKWNFKQVEQETFKNHRPRHVPPCSARTSKSQAEQCVVINAAAQAVATFWSLAADYHDTHTRHLFMWHYKLLKEDVSHLKKQLTHEYENINIVFFMFNIN